MADLARQCGNTADALELASTALAIFTELQMPRERDAVQRLIDGFRKGAAS